MSKIGASSFVPSRIDIFGVTSSGICLVFFAHLVIADSHCDNPAIGAMSDPPTAPGSSLRSCHS